MSSKSSLSLVPSSVLWSSPSAATSGSTSGRLWYCRCPTPWPKCRMSISRSTKLRRGKSVSTRHSSQKNKDSHVYIEVCPVVCFLRIQGPRHRLSNWQQDRRAPFGESRNDMHASDNLHRVEKSEGILVR